MRWSWMDIDQTVRFSGDGYFRPVIEAVRRRGVRVHLDDVYSAANDRRRIAPPGRCLHRPHRVKVQDRPRIS